MHKRPVVAALALLVPLAVGALALPAQAQAQPRPGMRQTRPVRAGELGTLYIAGRKVLQVAPTGYYDGQERVLENMRRVIRVIEPELPQERGLEAFDVNRDVQVRQVGKHHAVFFKTVDVATVTPADTRANNMAAGPLAEMWANNLKAGLQALQESSNNSLKTALSEMRTTVGNRTIATGITGSTDTMVAYRIRRAFDRDPDLAAQDVFVDVRGDEVILRGEVPDRRVERRVETIAEDEALDRNVRSDLRIEGSAPGR